MVFAPGVALRLALSTLLGLDDQPGTLPGTGPRPRRHRPHRRPRPRRRELADPRPRPARPPHPPAHPARPTRHHPRPPTPPPDRATHGPGGTAPRPRRTRETPTPTRAEAPGLAGARCRAARRGHDARGCSTPTGALVRSETADPEDHPATTTRERDRRFPGAALARWVAARDQTCIALGCARPAEACDIDHTLDWIHGGRTEAADLDLLCRHDHRAKHDGGWHYEQPEPGSLRDHRPHRHPPPRPEPRRPPPTHPPRPRPRHQPRPRHPETPPGLGPQPHPRRPHHHRSPRHRRTPHPPRPAAPEENPPAATTPTPTSDREPDYAPGSCGR